MKARRMRALLTGPALLAPLAACGDHDHGEHPPEAPGAEADHEDSGGGEGDEHGEDHEHAEDPLGTVDVGGLAVELAQGHGAVTAGEEAHLVVKLPYTDDGATVVRAWIGSEDRTLSYVGRGEYAPSHDDYDVHATAPDPLPEGALWWVEIERPDGTVLLGSAEPIR